MTRATVVAAVVFVCASSGAGGQAPSKTSPPPVAPATAAPLAQAQPAKP